MSDLTDEELDDIKAGCSSRDGGCDVPVCRLAWEVRRHRSAQVASEELVRSVVRDAIGKYASYVEGNPLGGHGHVANDIATRAAKQLAGTAVGLSEADRIDIEQARDYIASSTGWNAFPDPAQAARVFPIVARWIALLDRLLGAP